MEVERTDEEKIMFTSSLCKLNGDLRMKSERKKRKNDEVAFLVFFFAYGFLFSIILSLNDLRTSYNLIFFRFNFLLSRPYCFIIVYIKLKTKKHRYFVAWSVMSSLKHRGCKHARTCNNLLIDARLISLSIRRKYRDN